MRKLIVFNNITVDGYFTGIDGDMSWAHAGNADKEFQAFVTENASRGGELLFGRITYDLMAAYWPSAFATEKDPAVAKAMNERPKIVFSKSLKKAAWNNTNLISGDLAAAVKKLKQSSGKDMVILGSGTLVMQLAQLGLIDQYQMMVNPIALGKGRSMFDGIEEKLSLTLKTSRTFPNGKIFLSYEQSDAISVN